MGSHEARSDGTDTAPSADRQGRPHPCPACGSGDTHRSRSRGLEVAFKLLLFSHYRCARCDRRFRRFRPSGGNLFRAARLLAWAVAVIVTLLVVCALSIRHLSSLPVPPPDPP